MSILFSPFLEKDCPVLQLDAPFLPTLLKTKEMYGPEPM